MTGGPHSEERVRRFVRDVSAHLVDSPERIQGVCDELTGHLTAAAEVGELEDALERLGSAARAASTFSRDVDRPPAPLRRRFSAAVVDLVPLIAVTIVGILEVMARQGSPVIVFPPVVAVQVGEYCVSPLPLPPLCEVYPQASLHPIGLGAALVWAIPVLALIEHRSGTTPGKRMFALKTVTVGGTRVSFGMAVLRRVSLLAGPVAWIDWVPCLWGDRGRLLDRLSDTMVVDASG
ncbi:RDD family protein [Actinotalea sp. C106]|uniref:RDD family protein n=1 Tax=Actinotalea sp. C106 TaxID=2908644 RepID=UPI002029147C|nr:RDD family protein [Actinotalea sp. C106]